METIMDQNRSEWLEKQILDRFVRYVRIETTSDRHGEQIPSTPGQWDLLRLLVSELEELGIEEIELDGHGYLIARLPSNIEGKSENQVIGFLAHVDTSAEASGKDVKPQLHHNYDGSIIELKDGITLDPGEFPDLLRYKGETIITADGTTLLGADDKAGIAEIMAAVAWLREHPDIPHGTIEIIFTPDEETGKGLLQFPIEKLCSGYCYTIDGDGKGIIEAECFYGYKAVVKLKGVNIHPGKGRGKLMNAVTMASQFVTMLPRNESPEATDGRFGFYLPIELTGTSSQASLEIYLRDFDYNEIERRTDALRKIATVVEAQFPGGKVTVETEKQYVNMRDFISKDPRGIEYLKEAIKTVGLTPVEKIIRGGTDGARLSEQGIPTPNVFTGGANYHGEREWIVVSLMVKTSETIIELAKRWAGADVQTGTKNR